MNSIDKSCNELKKNYDSCFYAWFKDDFLKGGTSHSLCTQQFREYLQCIEKSMKEQRIDLQELERDVLGTDKECKSPPKAS